MRCRKPTRDERAHVINLFYRNQKYSTAVDRFPEYAAVHACVYTRVYDLQLYCTFGYGKINNNARAFRACGFSAPHARVPTFIISLFQKVQYAVSRKTHSGGPGRGGPELERNLVKFKHLFAGDQE